MEKTTSAKRKRHKETEYRMSYDAITLLQTATRTGKFALFHIEQRQRAEDSLHLNNIHETNFLTLECNCQGNG